MPVIVLATSGRDVLIGQGGRWITDLLKSRRSDQDRAFAQQKIRGFPNTPDGKRQAIAEAGRRATEFGVNTKFTEPKWKDDGDPRYSTRFLSDQVNPPGFIKGTFPDKEYPGEEPIKAAVREFGEETGYTIDESSLTEVAPGIFRIEIPQAQKSAIIQSWRRMGRMGELFELRWEPMVDIRKDVESLNPESKTAVPYLPTYYAGTRRRRRRKVYKSRKQKR